MQFGVRKKIANEIFRRHNKQGKIPILVRVLCEIHAEGVASYVNLPLLQQSHLLEPRSAATLRSNALFVKLYPRKHYASCVTAASLISLTVLGLGLGGDRGQGHFARVETLLMLLMLLMLSPVPPLMSLLLPLRPSVEVVSFSS